MASEIEKQLDSLDVADDVKRRAKRLVRFAAHRVTWYFAESCCLYVDLYGSDGAACIRNRQALLGNVTAGAILDSPYLQALEELAEATLRRAELDTASLTDGAANLVALSEERSAARDRQHAAIVRLRALKGTG